MKNPWLGLSSYTEESLSEHKFYGRAAAIATLTALIRNNLFVTLYGRSGIGKTSLLQAGVFPRLRLDDMLPVTIRLNDVKDKDKPAAEVLWTKLCATLKSAGYNYTVCDDTDVYVPDFEDVMVFRMLFSAGRFLDDNGKETYPVIVLDQFEEIFYKAPEAARLLVTQLYALIDDNYNIQISHPTWHDDTNFRLVVSIREDDLYLFEDCIDTFNCADFKSNRFRLTAMSEAEAREVILEPCREMFQAGQENEVAEGIISLCRTNGQNINTLMLSLTCYMLFENSIPQNLRVSVDDLKKYSDSIETYYEATIKDLPKEERYYLEDSLVDYQGRRTSVYVADLERRAPKAKEMIDNGDRRLLNLSQGRVEFIHDQLAAAVSKLRRERKSSRARQWGIAALIIILLSVFIFSISKIPGSIPHDKIVYSIGGTICNNPYVQKAIVSPADNMVIISGCPNIKTIDITDSTGLVNIFNCPNLVTINYPKSYEGFVRLYNCPNVKKNDIIRLIDPSVFEPYNSEAPSYYPDNLTGFNKSYVLNYDSVNHHLYLKWFPCIFVHNTKNYIPINTDLPDTVKNITDCFVPYGTKKLLTPLPEFQPFRSINERPIYHTWGYYFSNMFGFFLSSRTALYCALAGLLLIQIFFWITSYFTLTKNKRREFIFVKSLAYGSGMSLIGMLAFMAFYWPVYNYLILHDQPKSTIMGLTGCLLCIALVYKNSFYAIAQSIQENGFKGALRELWKNLCCGIKNFIPATKHIIHNFVPATKRIFIKLCHLIPQYYHTAVHHFKDNNRKYIKFLLYLIFYSLLFLALNFLLTSYNSGKDNRQKWLSHINNLLENEQYAKASSLIADLDAEHSSFIYPFFADSLQSLADTIRQKEKQIFARFTPEYINQLAAQSDIKLDIASCEEIEAISKDETKIVVLAKLRKENSDRYQLLLVDLKRQTIDTVAPLSRWYSDNQATISPSGNIVISTSNNDHRYCYNTQTRQIDDISNGLYKDIDGLLMINDSVYYFADYPELYLGISSSNSVPIQLSNSSKLFSRLHAIDEHTIAGRGSYGELVIFDLNQKKVVFQSKHRSIGDVRGVNQLRAITSDGLLDITKDSILVSINNLYEYKGDIVQLMYDNAQKEYSLNNNGKSIFSIPSESDWGYETLTNNFLIKQEDGAITIYRLAPGMGFKPELTERDREIFDLD